MFMGKGGVCAFFYKFNLLIHRSAKRGAMKKLNRVFSQPLLWNYLITPLYMGYPREAVAKLLLPAFLPFNLLKAGLNVSFTFLLYKPVISALRKSGYVAATNHVNRDRSTGLILLAIVIIITCILFILSMNGLM